MLNDILAVLGKPGLFRLVSKGKNMTILESLTDKKRIPVYTPLLSLNDITIHTEGGEEDVPLGDVLTAIREKEGGVTISMDFSKADNNELRAYFAEILPNFDREKVYPTEIKKMMRWYNLLIDNGITDFSKKETEENSENEIADEHVASASEEGKEAHKITAPVVSAAQPAKPATAKRKDTASTPLKPTKTTSMPKNAIPKKSVVGSKRGS